MTKSTELGNLLAVRIRSVTWPGFKPVLIMHVVVMAIL